MSEKLEHDDDQKAFEQHRAEFKAESKRLAEETSLTVNRHEIRDTLALILRRQDAIFDVLFKQHESVTSRSMNYANVKPMSDERMKELGVYFNDEETNS